MAPFNDYRRLQAVLWKGYRDLPQKERHPDLDLFQQLAPRLGGPNPPDPVAFDELHQRALPLARSLVDRGLLQGDLDGDESAEAAEGIEETTSNTNDDAQAAQTPDQPVAAEQQQAVGAVAPAVLKVLGVAAAPVVGTTTTVNDDATAQEPAATPEPTTNMVPTRNVEIPSHAVANIFPMMSADNLKKLAEDIKENGLHEPIWIHDGKIIDGRNRYRACLLAGVEPRFQPWDGKGSLVTLVLSLNLHRRHLTDQQRALVAARAKTEFEAESLQRRESNLRQIMGSTEGLDPTLRSEGRSADRAAAMLQVSTDATKKAAKVLKGGAPELVAAVEHDVASLDAAALVATLPVKEQREIVKQGKVKEKAKELRDARAKAKTKADKPKDTAAQPQGNAADTAHGEQQTHGEQPEARADEPSSSTASSSTSTSGKKPSNDTSSTAALEMAAQEQADAKPTASETATTEAKPTAPKFTVEQLICMTVNRAAKKPSLAPDIIHRTAEAAGIEVLIVDSVTRDAVKELANLLQDKLGDLASDDYQDACDVLNSIDEDLWAAVNAHAPEDEHAELEDDEGEDDWSEGDDAEAGEDP